MLAEHQLGRQYTQALLSAAQDLQDGDPSAGRRIINSTRSYIALLRNHIVKEDTILFPMAAEVIPEEQHARVWAEFEQVENSETGQGVHERYLALAGVLEQQAPA
jgi:hemerythrin-like domain-containing protein